jgi:TolB-like protein/Flp pilus assembly protein TadD
LLYQFADCGLDTDRRELRRGVELIPVEPQVFDLLEYLVRNRDRVVSKDDLVTSIWHGRIVSESALATRINAARSAIGDSGDQQRLIKTLPRKGIRFVGAVREDERHPQAAPVPGVEAEPARSAPALPGKPSIAVLPFTNMTDDPEQGYFADGMADDIITALSRCNWLFVIARNSSFTYKGKAVDVRQVGRELGVRYVMEGSVRRSGNRLRFVGQLIDAASGAHIWADRFQGEMSDVFDLQDRMTESVVAAIEPNLQRAEVERLKQKPAASLSAYELLLRAQQLEYEFSQQSVAEAILCLERALVLDPSYAPAMALAAYCYAERRHQAWARDIAGEAAEGLRLALRAIDLAKDDSNVLWMAAFTVRHLAMDAHRAKQLVDRSLQLNPNSAIALAIAAWIEVGMGNAARALELASRADRLSPRDPRGWFIATVMGLAHFHAGQFEQAEENLKRALVQNSRFATALRILAASLAKLGRMNEAAAVVQELLKIDPQLTTSNFSARSAFLAESVRDRVAHGLRLAGLPE